MVSETLDVQKETFRSVDFSLLTMKVFSQQVYISIMFYKTEVKTFQPFTANIVRKKPFSMSPKIIRSGHEIVFSDPKMIQQPNYPQQKAYLKGEITNFQV